MNDVLARLVAYRSMTTPSDPGVCRLIDEAIYALRAALAEIRSLNAEINELKETKS